MGLSELDLYISVKLVRYNGLWFLEGRRPQGKKVIRWVPSETELKLMHDGRRHIFPVCVQEDNCTVNYYVDYARELHLRHTTRCYYSRGLCPYKGDDGHCDIADGFMYPYYSPCDLGGLEARTVVGEYDFTDGSDEEDEDDDYTPYGHWPHRHGA